MADSKILVVSAELHLAMKTRASSLGMTLLALTEKYLNEGLGRAPGEEPETPAPKTSMATEPIGNFSYEGSPFRPGVDLMEVVEAQKAQARAAEEEAREEFKLP